MASAIKTTKETEKTIKVTEEVFVLTLSKAEATALRLFLSNVGGDPYSSIRKYADSIDCALVNVFVQETENVYYLDSSKNSIYAKDGTLDLFNQQFGG